MGLFNAVILLQSGYVDIVKVPALIDTPASVCSSVRQTLKSVFDADTLWRITDGRYGPTDIDCVMFLPDKEDYA